MQRFLEELISTPLFSRVRESSRAVNRFEQSLSNFKGSGKCELLKGLPVVSF